ncbi:hypothetical protein G7062_05020 [Erysipelothrix sp. HDW6C]|uniref:hypothetical protein n=1 Tax=Erysipelothrix sp. HDW6C TaxID=2714930 RepID=UPI00140DBF1B|nr:hypothetical protein [Erysipelothrix sp. HDW6C]QIK69695.1 hypothetical protein G7062_05020 [Erysipelothrix sp. HDW6C]
MKEKQQFHAPRILCFCILIAIILTSFCFLLDPATEAETQQEDIIIYHKEVLKAEAMIDRLYELGEAADLRIYTSECDLQYFNNVRRIEPGTLDPEPISVVLPELEAQDSITVNRDGSFSIRKELMDRRVSLNTIFEEKWVQTYLFDDFEIVESFDNGYQEYLIKEISNENTILERKIVISHNDQENHFTISIPGQIVAQTTVAGLDPSKIQDALESGAFESIGIGYLPDDFQIIDSELQYIDVPYNDMIVPVYAVRVRDTLADTLSTLLVNAAPEDCELKLCSNGAWSDESGEKR